MVLGTYVPSHVPTYTYPPTQDSFFLPFQASCAMTKSVTRIAAMPTRNTCVAGRPRPHGLTDARARTDGWMDAAADGEMDGVIEIMMCDWQTWRVSDRDGCRAGSRRDSRAVQT